MAADRYLHHTKGVTSAALGAFAVTPSDTAELQETIRAVTIGQGGTLCFVATDGQTYTTGELPVGTYPVFAAKILATGTTAADITGWI